MIGIAEFKAEAERQARANSSPLKTHCAQCKKPFDFGGNVYSMAGARDTQIIGMCEVCFDELCKELDEDAE